MKLNAEAQPKEHLYEITFTGVAKDDSSGTEYDMQVYVTAESGSIAAYLVAEIYDISWIEDVSLIKSIH